MTIPEAKALPRWMLAALAAVLLFVVVASALLYRAQDRSVRQRAEEQLTVIAKLKVQEVVAWRQERLNDANEIAESPILVESVSHYLANPSGTITENLRSHFSSLAANSHYADVLITDAAGQVRFSLTGNTQAHANFGPAIADALHQRKPVLTDLHKDPPDPAPHIETIVPIFNAGGPAAPVTGYVILVTDATRTLYPLMQTWPVATKSSETLLLRLDGEDQVLFLNDLRNRPGTALNQRMPINRDRLPEEKSTLGGARIFFGNDPRGVQVVAALLPVPGSPWFLVADQDASEVFGVWRTRTAIMVVLRLILAATIGAIALFLWQNTRTAYGQALYESQDQLKESLERRSITLKAIGDGVIATDNRGRIDLLNSMAEALTGWSHGEAIGKPLEEVFRIVHETTREPVETPVKKVLREKKLAELADDSLLISRDGTERPIADSASPIHDKYGQIIGVVLVFRDRTEERRARRLMQARLSLLEFSSTHTIEELLDRSVDEINAIVTGDPSKYTRQDAETIEYVADVTRQIVEQKRTEAQIKRFSRLVESSLNEIYTFDAETLFLLDANQGAREHLGYSIENLLRVTLLDLMPELTTESFAALVEPLRTGAEKNIQFTTVHRRKNGEQYPVEVHLELMAEGRPTFVAFVVDITERKRDEAERERLRAAIDQAGESVLITDSHGTILYVNPTFERVTGFSREEAIGQNARTLQEGPGRDELHLDIYNTIGAGRNWRGRVESRRKDGSTYIEETTLSPMRDSQGNVVNYVAVMRDVTEQLHLQAQIQQAQKMESVGMLASGVAHDFNNMLGVILGYTELSMDEADPSGSLYAHLLEIRKAAEHSSEITRQLLAFARRQTIAPRVIDLNTTVEGMLKMLRRLIGEDIDLTWLPGDDLCHVKLDPAQIDQILANLCLNARDAIASVGNITLETRMVTLDELYCSEHPGFLPDTYVQLTISDDGLGMDKETMDRIFDPFFTTKGAGQGTGLGLATVYGIVKQNHGFINVYSEPGNGTTFRIYLPRHEGAIVEAPKKFAEKLPSGNGETILIVEDELAILTLSSEILERLGYSVLPANTPGEAIALAQQHAGKIQLLMTDVVMPEMNGRDLSSRVLSLCPNLKRLFMSGYTADVIANQGVLDEGVNFIEKPFSMQDLAAKVHEVLNQ